VAIACKTIGTFVVICSLWTLWSCKSWEELSWLATAAGNAPWRQIALVVMGLIAIGMLGAWLGRSAADGASRSGRVNAGPSFWKSATMVSLAATGLLAIQWIPDDVRTQGSQLHQTLVALKSDQLNRIDLAEKRRGYYEDLDANHNDGDTWFLHSHWHPTRWVDADGVSQQTSGFLRRKLRPSHHAKFYGGSVTSNRWGMRDQDYELQKPDGVFRIALLGSSHEWGSGVKDEALFESLVESRLNSSISSDEETSRYEFLNFAVFGYSVFERLYALEHKVLDFQPDAVLFVVNGAEDINMLSHLSSIVKEGRDCPYSIISEMLAEARATPEMSHALVEAKVRPFVQHLTFWCLGEFVTDCHAQGIQPCVVFRPSPTALTGMEYEKERQFVAELHQKAREFEVPLYDLSGAFGGFNTKSLVVSNEDDHCNERAHALLADELYRQMVSPEGLQAWRAKSPNSTAALRSAALIGN
jgi:hypothetical protein